MSSSVFRRSADEIVYEKSGSVHVSMAGPVMERCAELEALGWAVRVLDGFDHMQAMQATHVLPMRRPWLVWQLVPQA